MKKKEYTIKLEDYWNYSRLGNNHPLIKVGASHCLNKENNKMYLFGGYNKEFEASNELYEINTNDFSVTNQINLEIEKRTNSEMYYWKNNIIIIGGISFDNLKPAEYYKEIIVIDSVNYNIKKIKLDNIGFRFTSFFDYKNGDLYYTGGLNEENIIYKVNIIKESIEKIVFDDKTYFSRCGASSISYGDKGIIFSGFKNYNVPKCHSDYYIYNFENKTIDWRECNEFVGRTFSKTVLLEKYNSILFVFGTYNGMESSRSIIKYNYNDGLFDDMHIQEIPVSITEGIVFYKENTNKLYITGGLSHDKDHTIVHDIIWELDLNKFHYQRRNT